MVIILIVTSSVFIVMLMLELSTVFRYNALEKTESLSFINKTELEVSLFTDSLANDDLNQLIVVSHFKDSSRVLSEICTGSDNSNTFAHCLELLSVKKGYHVFIPPKSEILGNKKLVLSLVWKKITAPSEIADGSVTFYTIDLNDFDRKPIAFRGPYDNETLKSYNPFEIIPYVNKFDVLTKSTEYCDPPGSLCLIR